MVVDSEAYYSRKSTYGFNVQGICDWERRFIWAPMSHTASANDSTFSSLARFTRREE